MSENITDISLNQLPEALSSWVRQQENVSIVKHPIVLDYNYFTATEVSLAEKGMMCRC